MRWGLALGCVLLAAASGAAPGAETKWTEVKREASLIRLQLPGLREASREAYAWTSDTQLLGITYAAFQAAAKANYPRGESSYTRAFATASLQASHTLDAARLKEVFGWLKDRKLAVDKEAMTGSATDRQLRRFTVDGANCVAFEIFPTGVDRMRMGGGNGAVGVTGYYCGPPRVTLTDNDVQWVLWSTKSRCRPATPMCAWPQSRRRRHPTRCAARRRRFAESWPPSPPSCCRR
jgi:hypothetical protein